jgi:hypothetical protein
MIRPFRPHCINPGCGKPVAVGKTSRTGRTRYRVHCKTCYNASIGRGQYDYGVTEFKKHRCSNTDGHLGWPCSVDWDSIPEWARKGLTDVDHINGNNLDNRLENLAELCPLCHRIKGRLNGDHGRNPQKRKKPLSVDAITTQQKIFETLFE